MDRNLKMSLLVVAVLLGLMLVGREQMDLPGITHWLVGASSQKLLLLWEIGFLELERIQKHLPP